MNLDWAPRSMWSRLLRSKMSPVRTVDAQVLPCTPPNIYPPSAILEVELGIPNEMQKFTFSSRVLSERGKTIGEYGIHEGSSVNVATAPEPRSGAPAIHASTAARRRSNIQRGPIIDPEVYPSLSLEGRCCQKCDADNSHRSNQLTPTRHSRGCYGG